MIGGDRPASGWTRWVGSVSDALPGGHLSLDAVVAFVDDELAPGPAHRADEHVRRCLTCAAEVAAQRQARRRVRGAGAPGAPSSLLSRLCAIPAEADLPPAPSTLAVDAHGRLVAHMDDLDAAVAAAGGPPAGTVADAATRQALTDAASGDAPRSRGLRRGRRSRRRAGSIVVASGLAVGAAALAGTVGPTAPTAGPAAVTTGPAASRTATPVATRVTAGPTAAPVSTAPAARASGSAASAVPAVSTAPAERAVPAPRPGEPDPG